MVYARVADQATAEEAVRRHVNASANVVVKATEWVDGCVFDDMKIADGRVGQWL